MGNRLTYKFVRSKIEESGYTLLSREYENSYTKLEIECDQGHVYWARWDNFKQGQRCPACASRRQSEKQKLIVDFVREEIGRSGYQLLSTKYQDARSRLEIRCDRGHIYKANWNNFKTGHRCPHCAGLARYTIDFIRDEIQKTGCQLLSREYKNAYSKLEVMCAKNHVYQSSWTHFQRGRKCPICAGNIKYTIDLVRDMIQGAGYQLLSKEYKNNQAKLKIQCDRGHVYCTKFSHFQQGSRCPVCAEYGFNPNKPAFLYYAKFAITNNIYYKIGITNRIPQQRLKDLDSEYQLLWSESFLFGKYAYEKEQEILKKYDRYLVKTKIPELKSGWTEVFSKDVLKLDISTSLLSVKQNKCL